ncbi:MAG: hypothetical protein V8Q82_09730 [Christensenellales bacterium]
MTGYTVKIEGSDLYKEADIAFTGEAKAEGVNANRYPINLKAEQFSNANGNFTNVRFEIVEDGELTITKRAVKVTVVGNHESAKYDKQPHTAEGYEKYEANDELYSLDDVVYSGNEVKATRTEVGTTYMGLEQKQYSNKNDNFDVTFEVTDGYVTIENDATEIVVKITGNKKTETYNGKSQEVTGYTVKIEGSNLYKEADIAFTGEAKAEGVNANKYPMNLKAEQFSNANGNFTNVRFEIVEDGELTITKRAVTVTVVGNHESAKYDKQPHTAEGYEKYEANDELYSLDDVVYSGNEVKATRTEVGTTYMGLEQKQYSNKNDNFDVTFEVTDGYVTIENDATEIVVKITGNKKTETYNGKSQEVTGYTVKIEGSDLYKEADIAFTGEAKAEGVNANKYPMNLKAEQFSNANGNFTNVRFEIVEDGELTITKRAVTVTVVGNHESAKYDKQPHTAEGYEKYEANDELYSLDDVVYSGNEVKATRTEVGTTYMGLEQKQYSNKNDNFDVTFEVTDGYVTIENDATEIVVKITGNKKTETYNGKSQEVTGYTVKIEGSDLYKEADIAFTGEAKAEGVNANKYPMNLKAEQFSNANGNFTNVRFEIVEDGELTITKRAVTVTVVGNHESAKYDKQPHTAEGYEKYEANDELYSLDDVVYSGNEVKATRTEVGTTYMGLEQKQYSNKNDNFDVTFEVTDGYVTIENDATEIVVKITGNKKTETYNGKSQEVTGYTVKIEGSDLYKEADIAFTGEAKAEGVNANKYPMNLKAEQFSNANGNFTNVRFEIVEDGELTITKRAVTVTVVGNHESAKYDKQPHTAEGYEKYEANDELYSLDDVVYSGNEVKATRTEVGTTYMGLEQKQYSNKNDNFDVTFEVTDGYVTIENDATEIVVKITGNKKTETYNGKSQEVTGYTVKIEGSDLYKEADIAFTGEAKAEGVNANKYPMNLKAEQFSNANGNFTNVRFEIVEDGELTITKRAVTVTVVGNHESAKYDKQPHTAEGYEKYEANDELYSLDDVVYSGNEVKATRTEVGTTYMGLEQKQYSNKNDNFDVTFEVTDGYVTIENDATEIVVKITGNKKTETYNGKSQEVTGYTVKIEGSDLYKEADIAFTGEAKAEGVNANKYPNEFEGGAVQQCERELHECAV